MTPDGRHGDVQRQERRHRQDGDADGRDADRRRCGQLRAGLGGDDDGQHHGEAHHRAASRRTTRSTTARRRDGADADAGGRSSWATSSTLTGGTATFDNKNVGTGKTVTLTGATLTGADAGNYCWTRWRRRRPTSRRSLSPGASPRTAGCITPPQWLLCMRRSGLECWSARRLG